jgi:GTP-binding protein
MNLSLVDLPGYGYAKRSKDERKLWAELIDGYLLERPTLRAVALLVDVRRGLQPDDLGLIEMLETGGSRTRVPMKTIIVATKLDKLRAGERAAAIAKIKAPGASVYGFSTELPESAAVLWSALEHRAGFQAPSA